MVLACCAIAHSVFSYAVSEKRHIRALVLYTIGRKVETLDTLRRLPQLQYFVDELRLTEEDLLPLVRG